MADTDDLSGPRFSVVTFSLKLSHGRISIGPSKVASATTGVVVVAKCLSSRSTYRPRPWPRISRQPAETARHEARLTANARRTSVGTRIWFPLRSLDGSRQGGVSRVDQVPG